MHNRASSAPGSQDIHDCNPMNYDNKKRSPPLNQTPLHFQGPLSPLPGMLGESDHVGRRPQSLDGPPHGMFDYFYGENERSYSDYLYHRENRDFCSPYDATFGYAYREPQPFKKPKTDPAVPKQKAIKGATSSKQPRRKKMYSDYVGVTYNKTHNKFQACITHYRKQHYLGRYKLAVDAARAYDVSARELKGNGWKINFQTDEEYEKAKEKEIEETERSENSMSRKEQEIPSCESLGPNKVIPRPLVTSLDPIMVDQVRLFLMAC